MATQGDTVDILAGTYRETVTVHNSGTSSAPITFQAYNNESVTIDGANLVTGWTAAGGKTWAASMPQNLGTGKNQVFVDGQMMNEARWPNTSFDVSHPTMARVGSTSGVSSTSATIHDSSLTQPAGFWVGATLHIAAGQGWVFQTGTVTSSGPGYVTFSYTRQNGAYMTPSAGNHFYLSGVAGALDSPGEWFRSSGGQLKVWTPASDSPSSHTVEAKARLYAFDLSSASYIHIQGIHLFASTINTSANSTGVVLNGITSKYASHFSVNSNGFNMTTPNGIILAGEGDILENSVVEDTAGDGVWVSGNHATVTNNVVHDADYAGFDGGTIRIGGYGDIISFNTCYNSARDGILFAGNHDTITNNDVYSFGLQTTDLGGFYTSGYGGKGTVIADNVFHDGYTGGFGGAGIMFDESTADFVICHNITYRVNNGLRMNFTTHDMKVYLNTFDSSSLSINKDGMNDDWSGVVIEDNILVHYAYLGGANGVVVSHNVNNNGQFVNAAQGNYALLAGAPAVDAGMVISPYTNGYLGTAPDDGALERGKGAFAFGAR